jgi:toxin ParE1/3/4
VNRPYVLSKGAAADLREITRYSLAQWGEAQCRAYVGELERAATALAAGEGVFKDMGFILPGLRMVWSGKHCIFCMPQPGQPPLILGIFHEKMDIISRLQNRLR